MKAYTITRSIVSGLLLGTPYLLARSTIDRHALRLRSLRQNTSGGNSVFWAQSSLFNLSPLDPINWYSQFYSLDSDFY